jgi:hypothetical protein
MNGAQLLARATTAARRWVDGIDGPTERDRRPPMLIDRVTTAMHGARELMDCLFPSDARRFVASGTVAVGSLALAGLAFQAVADGDPATLDEAGIRLAALRNAILTVGGLGALIVGLASGYACLHVTTRQCLDASGRGRHGEAPERPESASSESA